uniref:Uncharacterized protein n=1 Tax=Oryza rufipogon TaxID=4529 RepID=A0A0E0PK45_ORYRU
MVWVRRRRSVWSARGATVARPFPANQRGREEREADAEIVVTRSASLVRAGSGRRGTRRAASVGFAQGLQRGCRGSQREPGAVGLALSLRASALAEGVGFADGRRMSAALQTEEATIEFVASRRSGQRDGVGWAQRLRGQRWTRQGIGQRRGRGVVSFAQPCSEIRGQRRNGRLGGDDSRLASYVFDGMPTRKERG